MQARFQRITPFLWFDDQAEDAAKLYTSVFERSRIARVARYAVAAAGRPAGSVMTVEFELDGQELVALNGGPMFPFTQAISLVVNCRDQAEVDHFWARLSEGGRTDQCGWLTDRFGVPWQVVPTALNELLGGSDPERARRAMSAMLGMTKLDIAELVRAAG